MDGDFINIYIDTLIKNVHDLTSKNIVLDTKLQFADKQIAQYQGEIENVNIEFNHAREELARTGLERDEANSNYIKIDTEMATLRQELEAARAKALMIQSELESVSAEKNSLAAELEKIQKKKNTTTE